jgi:PAS domain-containing protein
MNVDLELLAKRVGYVGAILGATVAAIRVGRALWVRLRYYLDLYRNLVELNEVLVKHGGALKIYATFTPNLDRALERLTTTLEDLRQRALLNEQRWRATHDDDPRAMFEAGPDGSWTWANGTFLELLGGRTLDEVLGDGWLTCCVDTWRERARDEWARVVRGRANFDFEVEFIREDRDRGRARLFLRLNACVMRDPNGGAMGWNGIVTRVLSTTN